MRFLRRRRNAPRLEREAIYPIHGHSLGCCGTPREPLTWFRCEVCGHTTIGGPYELPKASTCFGSIAPQNIGADGRPSWHDAVWSPMDHAGALSALQAVESPEIVVRVRA